MRFFAHITISTTILLLASGFVYYFLAPLNWGAGEVIMHIHLWLGLFFSIYLLFGIPKHIKDNYSKVKYKKFNILSYLLMGGIFLLLLSGILHFIPYISYFFTPIYYQFDTYELISKIHLICAIFVSLFFVLHLSMNFKKAKS
jgi:thiosulfate reductase cytochrome b subunit